MNKKDKISFMTVLNVDLEEIKYHTRFKSNNYRRMHGLGSRRSEHNKHNKHIRRIYEMGLFGEQLGVLSVLKKQTILKESNT